MFVVHSVAGVTFSAPCTVGVWTPVAGFTVGGTCCKTVLEEQHWRYIHNAGHSF